MNSKPSPDAPPAPDFPLSAICGSATVALLVLDEHQQCVYMNPAAERLTGYTLPEVQGRALHDVIHHTRPDGTPYPLCECPIDRAYPQDSQEQGEEVFVHKDGHFYDVAYTASPVREEGRLIGTVIEVRDISGQKQAAAVMRRQEAELRRSEERLALALEAGDLGFWDWDIPSGQVHFGGCWAAMLGLTPDEIEPNVRSWERLLHPDEKDHVLEVLTAHLEGRTPFYECVYRLRHKDDSWRWILDRGRVVERDAAGQPLRAVGTHTDVTARKDAELALERQTSLLRAITESTPDVIFAKDRDSRLLFANPALLRVVGKPEREILGHSELEYWPENPAVAQAIVGNDRRVMESGRSEETEERFGLPGEERLYASVKAPLRDANGRIVGIVGVARDVTEIRRAELALQESERFTRRILDNLFAFVGVLTLDGTLIEANRAPLEAAGINASDVIGKKFWDCYWWSYAPDVQEQLRLAIDRARQGETVRYDVPVRMAGGGRMWIDFQLAPLRDDEGCITHLIPSALDISGRRETEAALREKEALLDAVLTAAPAGIIVADACGKILRMNPANDRLWGFPPFSEGVEEYREWKGWWADGSERHGRRLEPAEWALARALQGEVAPGDIVEIEPFDAPGTRRVMINSGAPVRSAAGEVLGGVVAQMDITERVRVEARLRESEARFRALAENIPQLAWMTDETGWIFWYNQRWFDYTGTTLEEMQGWGWQQVHHPEHLDRVTERFKQHLASGEAWEDTFPLRGRDGEYRWFLSRAVPIRDDEGRVTRWFGTNTDITEQRETEEALREAARRKDEFLAMLAHELRNPLGPINNAVAILRSKGPRDPVLEHQRAVIQRQVEHLTRLVSDLLEVSRLTREKLTLQPEPLDLAAMLRNCAGDHRPSFEDAGLRLEVDLPAEPQWLEGDAVRLCQAVSNLLGNALRFTPRGGTVRLTLEQQSGPAGDALVLAVRDTGPGIPGELLPHLWEPFTQGKQGLDRSQGGLGLGLALVRGIVQAHGGSVHAGNREGGGAEFILTLPPLSTLRSSAPAPVLSGSPAAAGQRILVVEDNRDAAETLQELLEFSGYEVRIAADGLAGVEAARSFQPALVLCDIGLPGLSGFEVAERLRQDPGMQGLALVALSGYAQPEMVERGRAAGFDDYLAKPVDPEQLLHLIARHADGHNHDARPASPDGA